MPEFIRTSEIARPPLLARVAGPPGVRPAAMRVEVDPQGGGRPAERRNLVSRQEVLHRIMLEYDEMPGLRLTAAQAQRLFGLREDVCTRVLRTLVEVVFLWRDSTGSYARHGVGQ